MKISPRLFLLALVGVIATVFLVLPALNKNENNKAVIEQLLQQGDFKQSLVKVNQYLKEHPNDPEILFLKGKLLLESDPQEAKKVLIRAAEYPATQENAKRVLAAQAMTNTEYSTAETYLNDLLQQSPDDELLLLSMAETLFHQQKFHEALPVIRATIQKQPERVESFLLEAEILDELGRVIESVQPLQQAAMLSPNHPIVQANLAHALFFSGQLVDARKHLSIALKLSPQSIELLVIKAKLQKEDGEIPSAVGTLRNILEVSPKHLEGHLLLAELLLFQNEAKAALNLLEELETTKKTEHRTLMLLSRAAWMSGETEKAQAYQAQLQLNFKKR